MGYGQYSVSSRRVRATSDGYYTKSAREIFSDKVIKDMRPEGVMIRESRDSDEHPNSVGIIIALDVTGSMGSVPHHLVKDGLPTIMENITQSGMNDAQVMFLAIGDHEVDKAPLQIGQFETSDELLDKWLTGTYLEGGGGANAGESYFLAWYVASEHTSLDCFEKRGQKGFLFTIGDEPTLKDISGRRLDEIMGTQQHTSMSAVEILDEARKYYHVYHLHIKQTKQGKKQETIDGWKQLMDDNLILVDSHEDVPKIISEIVSSGSNRMTNFTEKPKQTFDTDIEML